MKLQQYLKRTLQRIIDIDEVIDVQVEVIAGNTNIHVTMSSGRTLNWYMNVKELKRLSYPDSSLESFVAFIQECQREAA